MYVSGEDRVFQENTSLQANYFLIWSLAGGREKSLGDYVPTSSKMKIKDGACLRQQRFNYYLFFYLLQRLHPQPCIYSAVWMKDFSPSQRDAVTLEGRKKGAVIIFFSSGEVQLTGISAQLLIR